MKTGQRMNNANKAFEMARKTALKMIEPLQGEEDAERKIHAALPFIVVGIIKEYYDVYEAREYMDNLKSVVLDFYNAKE